MPLTSITLDAPVVAAVISAVIVIVGAVWGVTRLDNNRVIEIVGLKMKQAISDHKENCPGAMPIVQSIPPSDSKRFLIGGDGHGG